MEEDNLGALNVMRQAMERDMAVLAQTSTETLKASLDSSTTAGTPPLYSFPCRLCHIFLVF